MRRQKIARKQKTEEFSPEELKNPHTRNKFREKLNEILGRVHGHLGINKKWETIKGTITESAYGEKKKMDCGKTIKKRNEVYKVYTKAVKRKERNL